MLAAVGGLALAAGFCVGGAQARSFLLLRAPGDARMIVDPAGIEQAPDTPVRRMWTVTVQRNILNETPPQPGYVRALNEYDCAAQKTRWKTFTAFSRAGAPLVSRDNKETAWSDVTPTSAALAEWRVACGHSSGDSAIEADSVAKVVIALMRAWDPPTLALPPPTAQGKTPAPQGKAAPAPQGKASPAKPK